MNPEPFKYLPLTKPDSIRLLHVHPSQDRESPIHCTLEHATLSECSLDIITPFTALSYVWGSPLETGLIYLDDHPVTVTLNLFTALRDLRDTARVLRLWADALCINQSDPIERSSQVSLMGAIYSTANHTVIHLSSSTSNSNSDANPLSDYMRILRSLPSNTSGSIERVTNRDEIIRLAESTMLAAIWFTRVWVFQELVLSSSPWIQSSTIRARWSDLCSLLLSPGITQPSSGLQLLSDMNLARGPHRQTLFTYLSKRRGLGATNPVDMIYSHLGLISDLSALQRYVPVDYELPCAEVYEDVARYFLESLGVQGPDLFFTHCGSNSRTKMKNLPSWAPDWSLPGQILAPMYRDNIISTVRLPSGKSSAFTDIKPRVLGWVGYQIATIQSLSHPFPEPGSLPSTSSREEYHVAAEKLRTAYHSAGVWWSGDEFGRYRHVTLRGKEEELGRLSPIIVEEWVAILTSLAPSNSQVSSNNKEKIEDDNENTHFAPLFKTWLQSKIASTTMIVGSDSEGLLNLMWLYLFQYDRPNPTVLAGRRLAAVDGRRMAVVSEQARVGDRIAYLAGMEGALVLRGRDNVSADGHGNEAIEEEVRTALKAKSEEFEIPIGVNVVMSKKIDEMQVMKCTVVGEAYVDGEVGWRKKDVLEGSEKEWVVFGMR